MNRCCLVVFAAAGMLALGPEARGWGAPHGLITEAALASLPGGDKEWLGAELPRLARDYCTIPDRVYADKELAEYARMETRPGVVYLTILHLPGSQPENFEVLRYFLGRAVAAVRENRVADAARYAGTLAHALEDWSCPAHAVPGDNMFILCQQLLPPPPAFEHVLLHGAIESGAFPLAPPDRPPRLLGGTVDEAAYHLLRCSDDAIVAARAQVIPIVRGLYAGDSNAVTAARQAAAANGAAVVADALHTMLCLGRQSFDPPALETLRSVDLSAVFPLDATNRALTQASFFSRPYWGRPLRGVLLEGGTNAVPLKLAVGEADAVSVRSFEAGLGTGTRSSLTWFVPPGVYGRFETLAGLHAELGARGNAVFEVLGDGRPLARVAVTGAAPARRISVPLADVTNLQLIATSGGGDGSGNYFVWAEPRLVK